MHISLKYILFHILLPLRRNDAAILLRNVSVILFGYGYIFFTFH